MTVSSDPSHVAGKFVRASAIVVGCVLLLCTSTPYAVSGVIVEDRVARRGQEVMLRADTKGRIFREGGVLVEFFVDEKSLGENLSGGDGVAFKPFTPAREGLYQVKVRSRGDEDSGLLLSLERGSRIVFVDVENSLLRGLFSREPRRGSKKAIEAIYTRFPIVYLQTGFQKAKVLKKWLKENEFPELPVIPWRRGSIFRRISKNDLRIEAVIAGSKVIKSARKYKALAFSFEETKDAELVEDWEEISKSLLMPEI